MPQIPIKKAANSDLYGAVGSRYSRCRRAEREEPGVACQPIRPPSCPAPEEFDLSTANRRAGQSRASRSARQAAWDAEVRGHARETCSPRIRAISRSRRRSQPRVSTPARRSTLNGQPTTVTPSTPPGTERSAAPHHRRNRHRPCRTSGQKRSGRPTRASVSCRRRWSSNSTRTACTEGGRDNAPWGWRGCRRGGAAGAEDPYPPPSVPSLLGGAERDPIDRLQMRLRPALVLPHAHALPAIPEAVEHRLQIRGGQVTHVARRQAPPQSGSGRSHPV
jgi:hypothetical protein